jgi:hypothetical protein
LLTKTSGDSSWNGEFKHTLDSFFGQEQMYPRPSLFLDAVENLGPLDRKQKSGDSSWIGIFMGTPAILFWAGTNANTANLLPGHGRKSQTKSRRLFVDRKILRVPWPFFWDRKRYTHGPASSWTR